jgi:hypothetical protein
MASDEPETSLSGGLSNIGKVVRVGDTVRRPWGPHSPAVHALLTHLEAVGFDGAPRFVGRDQQGRAVLSFIEGEVGIPPFPAWVADEALLDSVAALHRRFHDAVHGFALPAGTVWDTTLTGDPTRATLVGHNDLCVENVVVRDGRAVAFIDFDFAGPADPLWDVAIALRHWVPVRGTADLEATREHLDRVARFSRYCIVYGVAAHERTMVVDLLLTFLDQALVKVRERALAGQVGYVDWWAAGYHDQNRRAYDWVVTNRSRLTG